MRIARKKWEGIENTLVEEEDGNRNKVEEKKEEERGEGE